MRDELRIEKYLVSKLSAIGGKAYKWGVDGLPDRICIFPNGRIAFVEVKAPDGRLSPVQKAQHAVLGSLQHHVWVVFSTGDVDELLEAFS